MSLRRTLLLSGGTSGGGAGQTGRITINGLVFRDSGGAVWPWRGATCFLLYQLWLIGGPAAVDPVLADYLSLQPGPNTMRVLGMVDSFARLHPQDWPNYYDQLQPFAQYLWSHWQVRFEFVIFADSGDILPDAGDRERHAQRVVDTLAGEPNVFFEVANEPSQHSNLPGGDAEAYDLYLKIRRPGVMVATGAGDGYYAGDFVTVHTPRDSDQWMRRAKDLLDVRLIANVPCVADEPMGAAEQAIDGKRDTEPRNFADYAATAQLEGAGSTFHSDSGILSRPLQPVQRSCAVAFFAAAAWVPPLCQVEPFMRGEERGDGGCHWTYAPGEAPAPCHHSDDIELRSYGKIIEPQCWVTQVKTQRPAPDPCPGWAIDAPGPSVGLTVFRRA
jgi:hypothetical protein